MGGCLLKWLPLVGSPSYLLLPLLIDMLTDAPIPLSDGLDTVLKPCPVVCPMGGAGNLVRSDGGNIPMGMSRSLYPATAGPPDNKEIFLFCFSDALPGRRELELLTLTVLNPPCKKILPHFWQSRSALEK